MKVVCFSFFAVAALALVKADTTTPSPLELVHKQVSEGFQFLLKKWGEDAQMETKFDQENFINLLKTSSDKFQEKVGDVVKNIETHGKPSTEEAKKAIDNFFKQFNETIKALNTPETWSEAKKFQETLESSLKKVAEHANELGKSVGVVPPNIQKSLNEIYEVINKTNEKLVEKAKKFVDDAKAELNKKSSA